MSNRTRALDTYGTKFQEIVPLLKMEVLFWWTYFIIKYIQRSDSHKSLDGINIVEVSYIILIHELHIKSTELSANVIVCPPWS